MEQFAVLLFLAVYVLLIATPIKLAKKAKQAKQAARNGKKSAGSDGHSAYTASTVDQQSTSPRVAQQDWGSMEVETGEGTDPCHEDQFDHRMTVSQWNTNEYAGSLNEVTGEGTDPCHTEQLSDMPSSGFGESDRVTEADSSGPKLSWTGNEIVRGFVVSEVLKRRA